MLKKLLPNLLTISRLAIALVITSAEPNRNAFLLLITVGFLTDFLDGWTARTFKAQTKIGEALEGIADFALFGVATAVFLYENGQITLPVAIIYLALNLIRELYIYRKKSIGFGLPNTLTSLIIAITTIFFKGGLNGFTLVLSCFLVLPIKPPKMLNKQTYRSQFQKLRQGPGQEVANKKIKSRSKN